MRQQLKRVGGGRVPLLAAGMAFLLSGCSLDVFNPGAITDDSLNDPSLMGVVVNGVANEFNQIIDNMSFDNGRLTDELAGTGSYFQTGRLRRGAMDWEETSGRWAQHHETIWTARVAYERMQSLGVTAFDPSTSDLAARAFLLQGLAFRSFGENFCEVVFSTDESNLGVNVSRTVAFDSAIAALNRAITIGTAAGTTAGATYVTAAHGGLAQAYVGLGDWTNAAAQAALVPTSFEMDALFNNNSNTNIVWSETVGRAETGLFGTYAESFSGAAHDGSVQDPRVPYTICGTFDNLADPKNSKVTATGATGCTSHQGADGVTAHYQQQKYPEDLGNSDIPVVTGREMRLIEAEAAIQGGSPNYGTFMSKINEVRTFYGVAALTGAVSSVGTLEYPNAYNASGTGNLGSAGVDAMSVLDGERYLTMWVEGRRLFDLDRWNHPFLNGGIVFWDSEPRRVSCWPVPQDECTLNTALKGQSLLSGTQGIAANVCS